MKKSLLLILLLALAVGGCAVTPEWPQWGGPNRDFVAKTHGLADSWPEGGPERLWERELGDGYSSILVEAGKLYTMYWLPETPSPSDKKETSYKSFNEFFFLSFYFGKILIKFGQFSFQ